MPDVKYINLFIDANIWLSLFHFAKDDLAQFKKLKDMNGHGIRIFMPEQIRNEVYRNRENKIKDALDKFEKLDLQFPLYVKNYSEYEAFFDKFNDLKKQHTEWVRKVKKDIAEQNSPADVVLREVFDSIKIIPSTSELIQRGVDRYNIGNPPGKDNKYGDAINWETLLEAVPDGEDLYFVSADKDYKSIFNADCFHPFLAKEWAEKKRSRIIFYKSLVEFFKENVSEIQLCVEDEKDQLIDELVHSRNFHTTHRVIGELAKLSGWSEKQIQDICNAAVDNAQVRWILGDTDVYEFYKAFMETKQVRDMLNDPAVDGLYREIVKIEHFADEYDSSLDGLPF